MGVRHTVTHIFLFPPKYKKKTYPGGLVEGPRNLGQRSRKAESRDRKGGA